MTDSFETLAASDGVRTLPHRGRALSSPQRFPPTKLTVLATATSSQPSSRSGLCGASRLELAPAKSMGWSWLGLALICLPIALFRLATVNDPRVVQAAIVMLALCGLLGWRGLRVLNGDEAVILSIDALEGPSRRLGPLVRGSRTTIALNRLAHVREVGWGVWRAEGLDGRSIYWMDTHESHHELLSALARRLGMPAF